MGGLTYTINVHDGLLTFSSKVIIHLRGMVQNFEHINVTALGADTLVILISYTNGTTDKLHVSKNTHWKQDLEKRYGTEVDYEPQEHLWGVPITQVGDITISYDDKGVPIGIDLPINVTFNRD